MAIDFVSEVDRKFMSENMLTTEDWDFFNVASTYGSDLDNSDEFDIPMPDDLNRAVDSLLREHSDSSDSGIHNILIKEEPLSPATSESSQDSLANHPPVDHTDPTETAPPFSPASASRQFTILSPEEDVKPALFFSASRVQPAKSVASIVNSKIRIQPRVHRGAGSVNSDAPTVASLTEPKPSSIVLSSNEFVKLTNQGLLRFTPPNEINAASTQTVHPESVSTRVESLKTMKRQQRMIKNRESASLSRKRKKEYMTSLEQQLTHYLSENIQLREENESLKQRLDRLNDENMRLKHGSSPLTRKTTCLLAVVLLIGFNMATITNLFSGSRSDQSVVIETRRGRHLMSVGHRSPSSDDTPRGSSDYTQDALMNRIRDIIETQTAEKNASHGGGGRHAMCPSYFNSTQSLKLAERLAGWVMRHEQLYFPHPSPPAHNPATAHIAKKSWRKGRTKSSPSFTRDGDRTYPVQVFRQPNDKSRDLFSAIDRRNDTFYVLSFNSDYFLLPATRLNKTMRPRMSLVVPALIPLNETFEPPEGSVGMMQIDCEVLDTRLIHIKKSIVPEYMHGRNRSKRGGGQRRSPNSKR